MPWCMYCGDIADEGHRPPCRHAAAPPGPEPVPEAWRAPARRSSSRALPWIGLAVVVLGAGGLFLVTRATGDRTVAVQPAPTFTTFNRFAPPFRLGDAPTTTTIDLMKLLDRIRDLGTTTTANKCSAPAPSPLRPVNGAELRGRVGAGRASLKVSNGTPRDAIVKLVSLDQEPRAALAVYVRASESFTIPRIARSSYRVAFAQGTLWSDERKTFDCPTAAKVFDDVFDFTTKDWEITLNPVVGGNAGSEDLSPKSFDAM